MGTPLSLLCKRTRNREEANIFLQLEFCIFSHRSRLEVSGYAESETWLPENPRRFKENFKMAEFYGTGQALGGPGIVPCGFSGESIQKVLCPGPHAGHFLGLDTLSV